MKYILNKESKSFLNELYLRNISYACIIVQIVFNSSHFLFE